MTTAGDLVGNSCGLLLPRMRDDGRYSLIASRQVERSLIKSRSENHVHPTANPRADGSSYSYSPKKQKTRKRNFDTPQLVYYIYHLPYYLKIICIHSIVHLVVLQILNLYKSVTCAISKESNRGNFVELRSGLCVG